MNKTYFAFGGILAAIVLFLVLGAAPPAPVQRNQFSTNVPGAVVLGPVAFDGAVNINGAAGIGGPTIISNLLQANNIVITNGGSLGFGTNTTAPDTFLVRDNAPNVLGLRNGTTAQTSRIYNTFTDSANYERGFTRWNGNIFEIGTEKAGTGTDRGIRIMSSGSFLSSILISSGGGDRWQFTQNGDLVAITDNTYNIGSLGANRPKNIYVGSSLIVGTSFQLGANGSSLTNILTGRAVLDFPSTAASSSSDLSITVTGATTNDVATVQAPPVVQLANSTFTCFASNNTVYVRFTNVQTVGALDPGAASFSVKVDRF